LIFVSKYVLGKPDKLEILAIFAIRKQTMFMNEKKYKWFVKILPLDASVWRNVFSLILINQSENTHLLCQTCGILFTQLKIES
jgi:hypothetical protein